MSEDVRSFNIGKSDYSKHKIQPWDIWEEYELNPWDADLVKRVIRTKEGEDRVTDYQKMIHICQERIRQLTSNVEPTTRATDIVNKYQRKTDGFTHTAIIREKFVWVDLDTMNEVPMLKIDFIGGKDGKNIAVDEADFIAKYTLVV